MYWILNNCNISMTQRWPLDSAEPKKNSALSRTVGTVLNKIENIFANSQKIAKSILSVNTGGVYEENCTCRFWSVRIRPLVLKKLVTDNYHQSYCKESNKNYCLTNCFGFKFLNSLFQFHDQFISASWKVY